MTYCLETTQSHHLHDLSPSCCGIISDIVQQEGGNGRKFPNNLVINLDLAEKILAKKDRRPRKQTMDIAFGCSEKPASGTVRNLFCKYLLSGRIRGHSLHDAIQCEESG